MTSRLAAAAAAAALRRLRSVLTAHRRPQSQAINNERPLWTDGLLAAERAERDSSPSTAGRACERPYRPCRRAWSCVHRPTATSRARACCCLLCWLPTLPPSVHCTGQRRHPCSGPAFRSCRYGWARARFSPSPRLAPMPAAPCKPSDRSSSDIVIS